MVIVACTTARGVVFQVVSETHDLQLGRRAFFAGFADDVLYESPDGRFRFRPTAQTHRVTVTVDGETHHVIADGVDAAEIEAMVAEPRLWEALLARGFATATHEPSRSGES
jgi:hypothetical protein